MTPITALRTARHTTAITIIIITTGIIGTERRLIVTGNGIPISKAATDLFRS